MQAFTFWKEITMDKSNLLERFVRLLEEHGLRYCVIGGQAVNAYVEPLVSLDLDVVIAMDQLDRAKRLLADEFAVEQYVHSLNVSAQGSNLRIQVQTDPRYATFVEHAQLMEVLGMPLQVARLEDVLQGKVWAAQDPERRSSKRKKDLLDIERILESYPELRGQVPPDVLESL